MLKRLYELREPVGAAVASLKTEVSPPMASEYETVKELLDVLAPFYQATVEVSSEKRVSEFEAIPLMKMLHHTVTCKIQTMTTAR